MKDRKNKANDLDRAMVATPVAVEFLEVDPRWHTGAAELVENRLRRLLPTGTLPLSSSTFRKR